VLSGVSNKCGLGIHHFVLRNLRQGGATHDRLMGVPLDEIQQRGLWKQRSSMNIYLATGICFSIIDSLHPHIVRVGKLLDDDVVNCFSPVFHCS